MAMDIADLIMLQYLRAIALRMLRVKRELTWHVIATRSADVRTCGRVPPGNRWIPSIVKATRVGQLVQGRHVAHAHRIPATCRFRRYYLYLFTREITNTYTLFLRPARLAFSRREDCMLDVS